MPAKIKFSVIIPVQGKYKKRKFDGCEVIYVKKYFKSKARNHGASAAHGNYLIHIDKDNNIDPTVLNKAKNLIQKYHYKTVVLEEYIKNSLSPWAKARRLERSILAGNETLSTPQIIETKLFRSIGGYDERFNELDDWALQTRLKSKNIKSAFIPHATSVFEPVNIVGILKRRFKKGQELRYFKEVYGSIPQLNIESLHKSYKSGLIISPYIFHLAILKFFDYAGIIAGSFFPIRNNISELYMEKLTAEGFDRQQKGIYGKLKHFMELNSLLILLGKDKSVLDLGAGTGRITAELNKKGFTITPVDKSSEMLKMFPKNLPKPVILEKNNFPFKNDSFDAVISIRVFWHIKDTKKRERFFSEAVRVAKRNIIMDISFFGSPSDHHSTVAEIRKMAQKFSLVITGKKYLPLSRMLIRFSKK